MAHSVWEQNAIPKLFLSLHSLLQQGAEDRPVRAGHINQALGQNPCLFVKQHLHAALADSPLAIMWPTCNMKNPDFAGQIDRVK